MIAARRNRYFAKTGVPPANAISAVTPTQIASPIISAMRPRWMERRRRLSANRGISRAISSAAMVPYMPIDSMAEKTVSSAPQKLAMAGRMGANVLLNYKQVDVVDEIMKKNS